MTEIFKHEWTKSSFPVVIKLIAIELVINMDNLCFSSSEISLIAIDLKKCDPNRTNFCHFSHYKDNINDYV